MKPLLTGCLLLVMFAGLLGWVGTIESPGGNSEEVLLNAERDWAKAVVDRDTLFVDRILSDDFVGWDYEGIPDDSDGLRCT